MPKGSEISNDDGTIRWPLVAASLGSLALAALLLLGVGQLFGRRPRPSDREAAALAASTDGPRAASLVRDARLAQRHAAWLDPTSEQVQPALDPALRTLAPDRPDPQLQRSQATTGGLDGGVGSFGVIARRGHVASVEGDSPVRPGASCDVRVLPVASGGFNCLVRVICDGALLYPNPDETAGYVSCDVDATGPTYASDATNTGSDGDPRLTFDSAQRRVIVGDGGGGMRDYLATITLDVPRPFRRL